MSIFSPTFRVDRFTRLTPERLRAHGIKGIVTDLDDTLAPRNVYLPDGEVSAWVKALTDAGIKICIVSNNHEKRTSDFASPLSIPFFFEAKKPLKGGVLRALQAMGLTADETLLLGDQLFTDMVVARRCGMTSVLVDPVGTYGGWFVQIKRKLETPLRKKIEYNEF